jgi:hypothetical protein
LRHLSYQERLLSLQLPYLTDRLVRGDMIFAHQILNHHLDVNPDDFFCYANSLTRGHNLRLRGQCCRLDIRQRFFTERMVSKWNSLPSHVVMADSTNSFKNKYDNVPV